MTINNGASLYRRLCALTSTVGVGPLGEGSEDGPCLIPGKFFKFMMTENGMFWCTLEHCF